MHAPEAVPGLTEARGLGLERFPVRARGESVTRSAWRLRVASEQGEGTIALVEPSFGEVFYRGEGVFLGWTQDELASAYGALAPRDDTPPPEAPQLG